MMNPVPYIEYNDIISEKDYKYFIKGLENDVISWDIIQKSRKDDNFITYAEQEIALAKKKAQSFTKADDLGIVYGSNCCLNLRHLENIPAFYNPPNARGEDTFFVFSLKKKDAKFVRIPTYHFHDCFLQYTKLMRDIYPKTLRKTSLDSNFIEQRFLKTSVGWIKYKPLYYYIIDREHYKEIMKEAKDCLKSSIPKINTAFETCDFSCLLKELTEYDKNVKKHYLEYVRATEIWDKLKFDVRDAGDK